MSNFEYEFIGQFGVPNVDIEQSLSESFDPYSGIDLRNEVIPQNSCIRIEGMRFPVTNYPVNPSNDYPDLPFRDGVFRPIGDFPNDDGNAALQDNSDLEICTNDFPEIIYRFNELRAVCADGSIVTVAGSFLNNFGGTTEIDSRDGEILFNNGVDACMSQDIQNTELFFASDNDKRQSLGLFYPKNINLSEDNFTDSLSDEIFTQISKTNLITNGNGGLIDDVNFDPWPGVLGGDSFKPKGDWNYITRDGVGIHCTTSETFPNDTKKNSYIQSEEYHPTNHIGGDNGYSGYAPYIYAGMESIPNSYNWDYSLPGLAWDMEWAKWVRSEECFSYDRCLMFSASNNWNDTTIHNNFVAPSYGPDLDPTPEFNNILGLINDNEYRTNNQACNIYNEPDSTLNPLSSLKVSFMMKTTKTNNSIDWNDLSDGEKPHVEASILRTNALHKFSPSGFDIDEEIAPVNYDGAFTLESSASFLISGDEDVGGKVQSYYYGGQARDKNHSGHFWLGTDNIGGLNGGILTG